MDDLVGVRIFSQTYNGIRFFFSIIRHERYFFQYKIIISPGISLQAFFSSKSVCRIYFFLKSAITPQNGQPLISTKHLLSLQIPICQSFLKPFETMGDKTL